MFDVSISIKLGLRDGVYIQQLATWQHYVEVKQIRFSRNKEKKKEMRCHMLFLASPLVGTLDIQNNSDQDGSHTYERGSGYSLYQLFLSASAVSIRWDAHHLFIEWRKKKTTPSQRTKLDAI